MPSYAILGATGNVGGCILEVLLQPSNAKNEVHALVRSKQKLVRLHPTTADNPQVKIFQANIDETKILADCIRGTQAVFLAVAVNENKPGCDIAQQTSASVLRALKDLREQDQMFKAPRLVVLSSASISDHLCRNMPALFHGVMLRAASNIYEDLWRAEKMLRAEESWVKTVFIKPGGLVQDSQKGHKLSLDRQQTFLSYMDLAAGMVEVAEDGEGVWDMRDVSVVPAAKNVKIEWRVPLFIVIGLLCHFFPWMYPVLRMS